MAAYRYQVKYCQIQEAAYHIPIRSPSTPGRRPSPATGSPSTSCSQGAASTTSKDTYHVRSIPSTIQEDNSRLYENYHLEKDTFCLQ